MMNRFGGIQFGWFFWIILLALFVWFVIKLLQRLKNNDLNAYFNISLADLAKNTKGEEKRNSIEEINN